jgi:hypothetical protein
MLMKPASSQETGPEPISELFLRALREGRVVVLTDASAPERGSVFISAGQNCNDGVVNFMASYARGLVAVALTQHRAERLGLTLQGAWRHDVEGGFQRPTEREPSRYWQNSGPGHRIWSAPVMYFQPKPTRGE